MIDKIHKTCTKFTIFQTQLQGRKNIFSSIVYFSHQNTLNQMQSRVHVVGMTCTLHSCPMEILEHVIYVIERNSYHIFLSASL
jgi:hypothetical protein